LCKKVPQVNCPHEPHLVEQATGLLLRGELILCVAMQPIQLLVKLRELLLYQRKLLLS